jgi:HEAT repeats
MRAKEPVVLLVVLAVACAIAPFAAWPFTFAEDSAKVQVDVREGLVSVEVRERPLREVLEELNRKLGVRYRLYVDGEDRVTISFSDLPIEEAFLRLFGLDAALVFIYPPHRGSSAVPSEVWMLGRGTRSSGRSQGDNLASPGPEPSDDLVEAARDAFDKHREAARDAAVASPHRDVRFLAIAHPGQQSGREVVSVLLDLLQDPDPEVRQSVTRALAGVAELGEIVHSDGSARGRLAQAMQTVDDPDVRLLAAETLGFSPPNPQTGSY